MENSDVEGEVIAKPRKNTRRVRWNIGGQFYETEHGAAFWSVAYQPSNEARMNISESHTHIYASLRKR